MKKLAYIAGALMLLIPALSGAQSLSYVAADSDAASLGMAGANLTQTGSVANASFYNAAVIPFSESKMDYAAGYTMWQPSAASSNIINAAGAININQKFGIAVGLQYGMNQAYDITDASGSVKGQFKPSDMHINAGFAYRFRPFLSLGANVGYATSKLAEGYSYGALAADVFAMAKFGGVKVTAGVANIGTSVTSKSGAKFCLPGSVALGAGYETSFADVHSVDVALDADYYFSGGFAAALGAAYTFDDLVSVRAGYRYGGKSPVGSFASVGVGGKFMGIKLDVAYLIGSDAFKNTLALTLGYAF